MSIPLLYGTDRLSVDWRPDNSFCFNLPLSPGIYSVILQVEMKDFDWESLYYNITTFGNSGERTGPWDFDLYDENSPLIPTWRLQRNARPLGLFYLQRPTAEDMERRTLRGEFQFDVRAAETVCFEGTPFRGFTLQPLAVVVEKAPFDVRRPQPWTERGLEANWMQHIVRDVGWLTLRGQLLGTDWERYLSAAADAYSEKFVEAHRNGLNSGLGITVPPESVPVLILSAKLLGRVDHLQRVIETVRTYLERPAWGNPDPDGYGHNGDFGAGAVIKSMTYAYNWLDEAELGGLRASLLARLERQMELFFEQQLLNTQYWGGALAQDHGYRSSPMMAFAAIGMLGHSESAADWLSFYLPRFERTMAQLPLDGFIPFSSYHKIQLYVLDMTDFRVAYQYASGCDLFAESQALRKVPAYILSCLDETTMSTFTCSTRGDLKDFVVGLPFFMALARDHGCRASAYLAGMLMRHYRDHAFRVRPKGRDIWKIHDTMPMAFLLAPNYDFNSVCQRPTAPALHHFSDGGALQYRDEDRHFYVSVLCEPVASAFHAEGLDQTGTDLMLSNASVGMFSVAVGGEVLINCAESGYRTGTALGNVLLIDGQGQYGDNGYPMAVPMRTWRGHRIQCCRLNPDQRSGYARLNLAPAYPESLGLLTYTRDFHFAPDALVVRDTVVTREPHSFAFQYNSYARHEFIRENATRYQIRDGKCALRLEANSPNWRISDGKTPVVWGYINENKDQAFSHLRLEMDEKAQAFVLETRITPL